MNNIYSICQEKFEIKNEIISSVEKTFEKFGKTLNEMDPCHLGFVGKHFAISPNEHKYDTLSKVDFQPHLLVECRLFNEKEEYLFTTRKQQIFLRTVRTVGSNGNHKREYIPKTAKLRNGGTLQFYHFIREDGNGYEFLIYKEINKNEKRNITT